MQQLLKNPRTPEQQLNGQRSEPNTVGSLHVKLMLVFQQFVDVVREKLNSSMFRLQQTVPSSQFQTILETRKTRLDIKVGSGRCVAAGWESEGVSEQVRVKEKPTSLDECLPSIIGNCLVCDVVPQEEVHTDLAVDKTVVG